MAIRHNDRVVEWWCRSTYAHRPIDTTPTCARAHSHRLARMRVIIGVTSSKHSSWTLMPSAPSRVTSACSKRT